MATATVELINGGVYDVRPQAGWWVRWRASWHNAKDWQVVLLDWQGGGAAPATSGDPISRHWTRRGARRAADWANLSLLPMAAASRFRYAPTPTRHPEVC